ncbi:MAG: Rpn family recombination-promoting nuclease/putative transposase [Roseimicrobium sp.]
MRFISPKTDFAFKKIFGSPGSQGILRSFLNAVLYEGQSRIASLEIVDPYSIPRLQGMKDSYLDVRAVLDDGQHVIIEMQVLNVPGMEKRVLYNAAKEYSNQLIRGMEYQLLNPVIALTITDFIMFPELGEQVITRFPLMEKSRLIAYPDGDVELVFVELPKFRRELEDLGSLTDDWLYFVRQAGELSVVPPRLDSVPEISNAFHIAETSLLTPEEDHALDLKLRWIADQKLLLAMKHNAEEEALRAKAQAEDAKAQAEDAKAQVNQLLKSAVQALRQTGMDDNTIAQQLGVRREDLG